MKKLIRKIILWALKDVSLDADMYPRKSKMELIVRGLTANTTGDINDIDTWAKSELSVEEICKMIDEKLGKENTTTENSDVIELKCGNASVSVSEKGIELHGESINHQG